MPDKLVIPLKHQKALLALVVETGGSGESTSSIIIGIQRRLIFVDFASFLSGILEPDDNDTRTETQQFRKVFQIIVFRVGIVLKEFLQHFDLVVSESGSVGPFALMPTGASRRRLTLRCRRSLRLLVGHHIG